MSAAVMHPTPALPTLRKSSVWEKMFGGFKLGGNKKDDASYESESFDSTPGSMQKNRQISMSTGIEMDSTRVHRRNGSTATKASIAPSFKSIKSFNGRAASFSSTYSRRSSTASRNGKWWRSSNPESGEAPPVPAIDSRFFGSHNPDLDSMPSAVSAPASRKASYVPRNAAGSFLSSTTSKSMKQTTQENLNEASRKLSIAEEKVHQAQLKALQIKTVELRKDSHVALEKNGMYSMVGACDIIEENGAAQDQAVSPTSHKAVNPKTSQGAQRSDSANASPELEAVKDSAQREPSLLEPIAA